MAEDNKYKILPVKKDIPVKEQFGFLPVSLFKPTKEEKKKWSHAYFNDGELDIRQGITSTVKMSEFHAGVAENIIRYWSLPGSRIVDPFAGRVTRAVVSTELGREYHGYEISPRTYNRSLKHFETLGIKPNLYLDNGVELSKTSDDFSDLIFTCPPYFDIEPYESVDGQLTDIKTYYEFIQMIGKCAENCYRIAKSGSFCVWVVADFRDNRLGHSQLMNFHGDTITAFKNAGWLQHDIVIMENISPFVSLTQYQAARFRYTPKTHEYILVFRKPGEYIIPDYCYEQVDDSSPLNKFFS
jgi:DNA modification methylase